MTASQVGAKYGFRSGLEETVHKQLQAAGIDYTYEEHIIKYTKPEKVHKYTPDFVLPNGIVVETKGRFVTADRMKTDLIKKQNPQLDLRMVFNNPNARISKTSKTTYAKWCEKRQIPYAKGTIPVSWLMEAPASLRQIALKEACSG